WMFNIDGLRRYNSWLRYRHCKAFAESIMRYSQHVLRHAGKGDVPPLSWRLFLKLLLITSVYGLIYTTLDAPQQIRSLGIKLIYGPLRLLRRNKAGLLSRIKRRAIAL